MLLSVRVLPSRPTLCVPFYNENICPKIKTKARRYRKRFPPEGPGKTSMNESFHCPRLSADG